MIESGIELLRKIMASGFYGELTLYFKEGKIVSIIKKESIKL